MIGIRRLLNEAGTGARLQTDFSERAFILADVLLQDVEERLGLLRADVHALEILDVNVVRSGLVDVAEHEEEIPEVNPNLNAVGVAFAVIGSFFEDDPGLGRCHCPTW